MLLEENHLAHEINHCCGHCRRFGLDVILRGKLHIRHAGLVNLIQHIQEGELDEAAVECRVDFVGGFSALPGRYGVIGRRRSVFIVASPAT